MCAHAQYLHATIHKDNKVCTPYAHSIESKILKAATWILTYTEYIMPESHTNFQLSTCSTHKARLLKTKRARPAIPVEILRLNTVTYTPGHEIRESPVIFLVEEQVTDSPAEWFVIIPVIYYLQHCLCMTGPWPIGKGRKQNPPSLSWHI